MATRKRKPVKPSRRSFTREFKQQAVQMLLDGYSASSVSDNLGVGNANLRMAGKQSWLPMAVRWRKRSTTRFASFAKSFAHSAGTGHLKKSVGHFKPTRVADLYEVIFVLSEDSFEVRHLCEALEVSPSAPTTVGRRPHPTFINAKIKDFNPWSAPFFINIGGVTGPGSPSPRTEGAR